MINKKLKEFDELFVTGVGGCTIHKDKDINPCETKVLITGFLKQALEEQKQEFIEMLDGNIIKGQVPGYEAGHNQALTNIIEQLNET